MRRHSVRERSGFEAASPLTRAVAESLEGRVLLANINGVVYEDFNGSGIRDAVDPGFHVRAVYADLNDNAIADAGEPITYTNNEDGSYALSVNDGTYKLRVAVPPQYRPTQPLNADAQFVTVFNGVSMPNVNFGFAPTVANAGWVSGYAYEDATADGFHQNDFALPATRIYSDLDGDATRDANEPFTVPNVIGRYRLLLTPGRHAIRAEFPAGYVPTDPEKGRYELDVLAGRGYFDRQFGAYTTAPLTAHAFNDVDGDGVKALAEPYLAGRTFYIDLNDNGALDAGDRSAVTGADGRVQFDVTPGTYTVRQVTPAGWSQTAPAKDYGWLVAAQSGVRTLIQNFGSREGVRTSGTINGTAFDDVNGDGRRDPGERPLANLTIWLDADEDGVFDLGERSTQADASGRYAFADLPLGAHVFRATVPAGYEQTLPAGPTPPVAVLTADVPVAVQNFGLRRPPSNIPGSISGLVFHDLNANGVQNAWDESVSVREVYVDLNGNGALDTNEPRQSNTPSGYFFANLAPGTYSVRLRTLYGEFETTTAGRSVTVTSTGAARADLGYTSYQLIPKGGVFDDANRNGVRDAGEQSLGGRTIYVDLNNNGVLDFSDPRTGSGATSGGPFGLPGYGMILPGPGTYTIRQVVPAGWTQTSLANNAGHTVTVTGYYVEIPGFDFASALIPPPPPGYTGTPFSGTPISIAATGTTTVQVEDFDNGGEGVAYHDLDAASVGGNPFYRPNTGVDLSTTTDGTAAVVLSYVKAGEWLKYSVDVPQAGAYNVGFRVASLRTGGSMHLEVDGVKVGNSISVPDTGAWMTWRTITLNNVQLPAGRHVLTLKFDTNGAVGYTANVNHLAFTRATVTPPPPPPGYTGTPFGGKAAVIAATGSSTVQAENFDDGGQGVAYHDTDTANLGQTTYRTGGVDVETINDAGAAGFGLGFVKAGEWLKYTVDVAADGTYALDVRLASLTGGGAFHLEVDGVRVTPNLTVPKTGAWTTYGTVRQTGVGLKAGRHVVTLKFDANGSTGYVANFNWIRFTRA